MLHASALSMVSRSACISTPPQLVANGKQAFLFGAVQHKLVFTVVSGSFRVERSVFRSQHVTTLLWEMVVAFQHDEFIVWHRGDVATGKVLVST